MWRVTLDVESNGFVVFDRDVVRRHFGPRLQPGDNLLKRFMRTDEGDSVLGEGIIVPVLAIDDLCYDIVVRDSAEPSPIHESWIQRVNEYYNLQCAGSLSVSDLEAIISWDEGAYGNYFEFPTGIFRVQINAFADTGLKFCGYEFVLTEATVLQPVTARTDARMRVVKF